MQVQQDQVGLGFLHSCQGRQHVLHGDVDGFLEYQRRAEILHDPAQMFRAALPVGGGLIQESRTLGAEFLDRVPSLRDFHDAVAWEETENPGNADLCDLRRAGNGEQRHTGAARDRQHGKHLRAEHGSNGGGRFALQRAAQCGDGALGRRARVGHFGVQIEILAIALDGQHRAIALGAALKRQEAGDRHQHGDCLGFCGQGGSKQRGQRDGGGFREHFRHSNRSVRRNGRFKNGERGPDATAAAIS